MYMYVYVCICMYMYVYVCICMYMYVCICMYMYVYVCMYMYVYVCICICIYIYIYIYNIYIYRVSVRVLLCRESSQWILIGAIRSLLRIYHRFLAEDLCVVQWQACHYVVSYEAAFYFIRHDLARQPAAFYLLWPFEWCGWSSRPINGHKLIWICQNVRLRNDETAFSSFFLISKYFDNLTTPLIQLYG